MKIKFSVYETAKIGIMAAVVFLVTRFVSIPITLASGNTHLHLGNAACLLAGLLLGPVGGGLSAGIGTALVDLMNSSFGISSAPFSFAFKFMMAFVCGIIAYSRGSNAESKLKNIFAAIVGAVAYIIFYLSKTLVEQIYVYRKAWELIAIDFAKKAVTSITNATLAVMVAVPLGMAVNYALKKSKNP